MCVRYTLHKPDAALAAAARALGVLLEPEEEMRPRYNVGLANVVPVISIQFGAPRVLAMRWGFIPPGDRLEAQRRILPNARAETLASRPAFREAAAARRCLVPANGFYEFRDRGGWKEPHVFMLRDEEPFAFAGLWEPPLSDPSPTFCIVTTEPNAVVAPIHDRMPVILTAGTMGRWLGERPLDRADLRELTRPLPDGRLLARRVDRYVNSTRNEGPRCLASPPEEPPELGLGL